MRFNGVVVIKGQLGTHQPVIEFPWFDLKRLNVAGDLLVAPAVHHFEGGTTGMTGGAVHQDHKVGFNGHRHSRGRHRRKLHTSKVYPGRRARHLAQINAVNKQRSKDVHGRTLSGWAVLLRAVSAPSSRPTHDTDAAFATLPATGATSTLSETDSKALLAPFGVPFATEETVDDPDAAVVAAQRLGFPVAAKLCGDTIAHKTERGLVRLGLADTAAVYTAASELLAAARPEDGDVSILIAPMVSGNRELIAGVIRDPQFGPAVMVGVGGVLAEAIDDVAVRLAPLGVNDAHDMIDELSSQALVGPWRGEPAVDRDVLAGILEALSQVATQRHDVVSIDLNPLIVSDGLPIAVDALVELADTGATGDTADRGAPVPSDDGPTAEQLRCLFDPRGVVVVGASTHPGKFGFVALHNILASGFAGPVYATNRDGAEVLGVKTSTAITELPRNEIDLAFVCTPAAANPGVLAELADRGVKAAFIASAGYGEAGPEGVAAQAQLVDLARDLGILIVGPNGQGVVSTPSALCAQIVAPYPPRGRIGIVSQSGNLVSSFMNYARWSGVGVSRAVSVGNAAMLGVADVLRYLADDPETSVAIVYVEGVDDGKAFFETLTEVSPAMPVVVVKGGATDNGRRAAASHTGSLANDDRVFDGMCRQAGVVRAHSVEEAFDAAAAFATQPLPAGPRVAVMTTVGGWGVMAADAMAATALDLVALPADLHDNLDGLLPPRWSRNNPIDLAGGETKDTIPAVLDLLADHDGVDAVVVLGTGIQANQGRMERNGGFFPDWGLERIVDFHERQDRRYTEHAAAKAVDSSKPFLVATELAVADPTNAAVAGVRDSGSFCFSSSQRAVKALDHLWRYARWRQRHR